MRTSFKSTWLYKRRADAAALACLVAFFVAFFPQAIFGGRFIIAGDSFFYSYPMRTIAWRMIRAGTLPLWTPSILSGYPLLSMAQLGLGYPLSWGYLFLPGHVAEQIYVLAPFLLAPLFTYLYLREIRRTPLAALFGALTFGYGGMMASQLANNGLIPNAVMWLPLFLIGIERARRLPFINAVLLGAFAYVMSVLTGCGQGFVYVGLLAGCYAFFSVFIGKEAEHGNWRSRLTSLDAWRPLLAAVCAAALAIGVGAFQILESARVVPHSVRNTLSYSIFTQGSFPPLMLWKSFTTPLFYVIDMTSYVSPLAVALALYAVYVHARRKRESDPRMLFWLAVAIVACVLMLGAFTPVYRVIYYVPLLNRFRVPSRHTFEWTFAVGVLGAYGWDAIAPVLRSIREKHPRSVYSGVALSAASIVVAILWWQKAQILQADAPGWPHPPTIYRLWKGAFVLLTAAALWRTGLIESLRLRTSLLTLMLLVVCYVEPSALVTRWWGSMSLPASRFFQQTDATRFLRQFPSQENRVYTRVALMSEEFGESPRFDSQNLSAIWDLQNVAGYEPLIFDRYSKALGGVWLDGVQPFDSGLPDGSLFTTRSHVLDILNTTFVLSYPNLAIHLAAPGQPGAPEEMKKIGELLPQARKRINVQATDADELFLITALSNSTLIANDETVARLRIFTSDGRTIERQLKAGRDTAEWAHERPDVRAQVRHKLAPAYDSTRVGGETGYSAYRYKAILKFDEPVSVTSVEIANVSQTAHLAIYEAELLNSRTSQGLSLVAPYSDAWQPVYQQHETLILRNTRALPRAWLVAEAEAVTGEVALRRIRGESAEEFDPRRTALLEVDSKELPHLPGGEIAPGSVARITNYEPNGLRIETQAPTATVLMVSEIFYPGWEATVDGQRAPIQLADFLLRGVVLPAGQHTIEMRYVAPAARNGAIISALTLAILGALLLIARRPKHLHSALE
jgi:Bacterial membrane protein YfhO